MWFDNFYSFFLLLSKGIILATYAMKPKCQYSREKPNHVTHRFSLYFSWKRDRGEKRRIFFLFKPCRGTNVTLTNSNKLLLALNRMAMSFARLILTAAYWLELRCGLRYNPEVCKNNLGRTEIWWHRLFVGSKSRRVTLYSSTMPHWSAHKCRRKLFDGDDDVTETVWIDPICWEAMGEELRVHMRQRRLMVTDICMCMQNCNMMLLWMIAGESFPIKRQKVMALIGFYFH